jgi:hypothetical protein
LLPPAPHAEFDIRRSKPTSISEVGFRDRRRSDRRLSCLALHNVAEDDAAHLGFDATRRDRPAGQLYLYRDRARILAGGSTPTTIGKPAGRQLDPARASRSARGRGSGRPARRHLQRQHLLDLGAAPLAYLTELTHRRPRTSRHTRFEHACPSCASNRRRST